MAIRFTNILKDLIIESSRFQVLYDKFVKPKERGQKGVMPFETLFAIIAADPTSRFPEGMDIDTAKPEDMEKVKIGKYAQWLLKNFVSPKMEPNHPLMILDPQSGQYKQAMKEYQELFLEDLYKVTGDLQKFERFKNRLPQDARDINKLTPETLYDNVKDFSLDKTITDTLKFNYDQKWVEIGLEDNKEKITDFNLVYADSKEMSGFSDKKPTEYKGSVQYGFNLSEKVDK